MNGDGVLRGRALVPGDRVRFVSPSSCPDKEWLDESVAVVESWGLTAEVGDHARDSRGITAGTDEDRLADLNNAFRDPGVRAVITTTGGAGSYRIAHCIDFDAVRHDPKPVVGFSDVTNLHLALWTETRLATIHGCLAGPTMRTGLRQLLMETTPLTIHRNRNSLSAAIEVPGRASGALVGGNLRELAGSVGMCDKGFLSGSIVLIEDLRHVGIGQVDRNLTQLIRTGVFDGVVGFALGSFQGFNGYSDRGWTVLDVLHDRLGDRGVPILGGLDIGHDIAGADGGPDQHAATLGAVATLDTEAGTLTVGPCVQQPSFGAGSTSALA